MNKTKICCEYALSCNICKNLKGKIEIPIDRPREAYTRTKIKEV